MGFVQVNFCSRERERGRAYHTENFTRKPPRGESAPNVLFATKNDFVTSTENHSTGMGVSVAMLARQRFLHALSRLLGKRPTWSPASRIFAIPSLASPTARSGAERKKKKT